MEITVSLGVLSHNLREKYTQSPVILIELTLALKGGI